MSNETFIKAATWHGPLDETLPAPAPADIFTAAVLGDAATVRRFLSEDPSLAKATAGPYGGTALVYLCMSKYLRLGKRPEAGFLEVATLLLDAGADPNGGFWTKAPEEFESALYGAAGVVNHAGLSQLLLDRGADPTDIEVVYHTPESYDNRVLELLVETGRLTPDDLTIMLIRKHDIHDLEGVRYLLEHGADPNRQSRWGWYPLHHALTRNNRLPIIQLLFDHGADPQKVSDGLTAVALAARVGRADVLALMAPHGAGTHHAPQDTEGSGTPLALQGVDRLLALCAEGDTSAAKALLQDDPTLLPALLDIGGTCLAKFATSANLAGVTTLLDIGVAVDAPFTKGDPYFGTPAGSLSIHVAASHSQPAIVRLLLARGAAPDTPDANGDTPLLLAVRACVDSYWKYRRTPEAVEALLQAGASAARVPYPCGYDAVDALLAQFRQ